MNSIFKFNSLFVLLCLFSAFCFAKTKDRISPPHELVRSTTESLIRLIEKGKGVNKNGLYYRKPQQFFQELESLIGPLVDFNSFTRVVMGQYGTKKYYQSLDKEQKTQFKKDYKAFVKEFKKGLINTYGKGLMVFNGQKVIVEPVKSSDWQLIDNNKMVDVVQKIEDKGKVHKVIFKMRPDKKGNWLFRNMIIDNINLGELYQNQFKAAMSKYKGNFNLVVQNWMTDMASAKDSLQ